MSRKFDRGPITGLMFAVVERDGTEILCTSMESAMEVAQRPSVDASHVRVTYMHNGARITVPHGERLSLRPTAVIAL